MGFPWSAGVLKQNRLSRYRYGMPVIMLIIAVVVYAGIFTTGCAGRHQPEVVEVVGLVSGAHSQDRGRDVRFSVATEPERFRALIGRISVPDRSPVDAGEIDFESRLVVAAFMGVCPTAGYSISFDTTARIRGNTLEMRVRTASPAAEGAVAQVITSPYTLVVVERTSYSRIRFLSADGRELSVLEVP